MSNQKINNDSSESIIDHYYNDWWRISQHKYLRQDFIRKYKDEKDEVDWRLICIYQKLSEKFIIEFRDKVDWKWISKFQKLSGKFIKENIDKLNLEYLFENTHLSKEMKQEIKNYKVIS